jgi:hypothetical protein
MLDWSQPAGGILDSYSTYDVASAVVWGLQATNLIVELGGHALLSCRSILSGTVAAGH